MLQDRQKNTALNHSVDLSIESLTEIVLRDDSVMIDDSQSELNLTMPTVQQPIRALSVNS